METDTSLKPAIEAVVESLRPMAEAVRERQLDPAGEAARQAYREILDSGQRALVAGNRVEAAARFEAALSLAPEDSVPHQRLCIIYRVERRFDEALSECQAWLQLETSPRYQSAIRGLIEKLISEADAAGRDTVD